MKNKENAITNENKGETENLLISLESFGLTREIWTFLKIEDVISLLITCKEIRACCIRINKLFPFKIKILSLLNMKHGDNKYEIFLDFLNCFPCISNLTFGNNYEEMDESLQLLYNNIIISKSLRELTVQVNNSTETLKGINNLINLTTLDLSMSSITYNGLLYLSSLININLLNLSNCLELTNNGLKSLSTLININTLNISNNNNFTNIGLSYLQNTVTNITSLNINKSTKITQLGFPNLLFFNKLTLLSACGHNIMNLNGNNLKQDNFPNLTHLDLKFLLSTVFVLINVVCNLQSTLLLGVINGIYFL